MDTAGTTLAKRVTESPFHAGSFNWCLHVCFVIAEVRSIGFPVLGTGFTNLKQFPWEVGRDEFTTITNYEYSHVKIQYSHLTHADLCQALKNILPSELPLAATFHLLFRLYDQWLQLYLGKSFLKFPIIKNCCSVWKNETAIQPSRSSSSSSWMYRPRAGPNSKYKRIWCLAVRGTVTSHAIT